MSTPDIIDTTATELTPELLDLMEHEKAIEQRLIDIGWHLQRIRDDRKYQAAGYSTFEDYCRDRWGMRRDYVNKQIRAAQAIREIERVDTNGIQAPESERQVRPLTSLPTPEAKAEAWERATEIASERGAAKPTGRDVAQAVEERKPKPVPKPSPKVGGERVEGAPPHPAVYSDAVLDAFREAIKAHGSGKVEGAIVDPFAGTGRIHELQADGWLTLGVELEPEWAELHPDTICGDSVDLKAVVYDAVQCESADVIATSPAYGNRLADHYEAYDPEARRSYSIDLGRKLTSGSGAGLQWGDEYRLFHEAVWRECVELLVPGGLFLLNCKDHQRDGRVVRVTEWHMLTLIELGLTPIGLHVLPVAGLTGTTAAKLSEIVMAFRKSTTAPDEPAEPEDDDTFDADEILVEADQVAELAAELGEVPECATFDAEGNLAPPWKAYTFVDDVRLIGGIREHASVDKLRWARAYETRNAARPLVLDAIGERLVELGAEL